MGGNLKEFLDVVKTIYEGDANYIRPLDQDLKDRLNPKKNPFFEHADGVLFTAHKGNRCVGRISASIDREHLDRYKDDTGFWGFLDTVDDPEVAKALLGRAEAWLRDKGMKRAQGPMSLSINEEIGCLIEGFDTPPVLMMPHHRPYQSGLIEKAGYEKLKDVFAWKYTVGELNARTKKAHEEIKAMPEVTSRPVSLKDVERDTNIVLDVFNDAWSDNWGFVPMTRSEVRKTAADFKLILAPEITRIAFIDGEPAAVAVTLPNVNDMIKDLNGKLFPFGLPKLLYRLKVEGPRSARLIILGIRKKYRHIRKYAGLSLYLFGELNEGGKKIGIQWGELGWTLEENAPVNTAIKLMGDMLYTMYRIYARPLTPGGSP
ncbi:MAG: hypothetical protein JWM74_5240 [Myxococcaceae bacterium]|nr:hypothetical protein [Myxococcaceae bacterium]